MLFGSAGEIKMATVGIEGVQSERNYNLFDDYQFPSSQFDAADIVAVVMFDIHQLTYEEIFDLGLSSYEEIWRSLADK